jgi:hypothetical protein
VEARGTPAVKAATMEATTADSAMKGSGTVKAATAMKGPAPATTTKKAATATAAGSLREHRSGASHGQGRQCTNYQSTHFSGCHDRSPSFL